MSEKTLRICHLYPDLLNLYGDRGNILCMRRRLEWRGIGAEVTEVTVGEQADFTQLFFQQPVAHGVVRSKLCRIV